MAITNGCEMGSEGVKQKISTDHRASTLAHGVRNPLNAIKGAVVYLKEKYVDDKTLVEFTKIMDEEISRLDAFLTRFLNSMAFPDVEKSEADINELLKEIEILTCFQAHAFNIKTDYEYGTVPLLMMDSFQLKQAILNIVNNAIEAMNEGGHLRVTSGTEKQNDGFYVVVEISDTGPGMKRRRNSNCIQSRTVMGRGYGLNITREVFQSHGGYMALSCKKGRGTVVRLCIPANNAGSGDTKDGH
jgi:two-component system nitrogen regulation sensor histidine kinase GlnL